MSTVTTAKTINVSQLGRELGQPISTVQIGSQITITCHTPGHTDAALQAAVDTHVAVDIEGNAGILRSRAAAALAANATYTARSAPTAAQQAAQIKVLTAECTALIRLALNLLDATD